MIKVDIKKLKRQIFEDEDNILFGGVGWRWRKRWARRPGPRLHLMRANVWSYEPKEWEIRGLFHWRLGGERSAPR
jgi:hypothetical protein